MPDFTPTFYPETRFGGFTNVDGSIPFFFRLRSLVKPDSVVLDIGCGRNKVKSEDPVLARRALYNLRGLGQKVIGIDPDDVAAHNPLIDEFRKITDFNHWPVEDASIDVAYSDFVVEHVENIDSYFSECHRVLKPGGYLCLRTPNVLSYFGIVSRLIPDRYHAKVAAKVQTERAAVDVFPTFYRCNTIGKMRRTLRRFGFDACVCGHEAEPQYFSFSKVLYWLATVHQRWAPHRFNLVILAYAQKLPVPLPKG